MTKSNASKEPMAALFQKSVELPDFLSKGIAKIVEKDNVSTARYLTYNGSDIVTSQVTVCFHQISTYCSSSSVKGLVIGFQGYGGFDDKRPKRWAPAVSSDLMTNAPYPFVNYGAYTAEQYNKESYSWLEFLLDPNGPFKTLLPVMLETTPQEVQARRAFIFPDVSLIPARLTWCFAIASRLGYANARTLWRYLHLLDMGLDRPTAALIAGGFEHEIVGGSPTGKIIKSYTCGFLGVDTTAYAGRFLASAPIIDPPYKDKKVGTNGSSEVFKSGKLDLKNLRFDKWEDVIAYTQKRGVEQSLELKLAA